MVPIRPREGFQKSQKPSKIGAKSEMVLEVRNEAFGLGFFVFFIGTKNKKSNFFLEMISNHSKMIGIIPKHYLNVILLSFTLIQSQLGSFWWFWSGNCNMSVFEWAGVAVPPLPSLGARIDHKKLDLGPVKSQFF